MSKEKDQNPKIKPITDTFGGGYLRSYQAHPCKCALIVSIDCSGKLGP